MTLLLLLAVQVADAAERADWDRVRSLLQAGADATAVAANRYGATALSLACVNGGEAMVTLLLDAGADPDAALPGGETALMTAARTGRPGPVKALLGRRARVDAKDVKGQTALMWAAADGHAAVVELLLEAGADARGRLKSGFTPLLVAARNGHAGVVQVLLKAGGDPGEAIETKSRGRGMARAGTSALLLAVENGHFELAIALVKAGADANDQRSGFGPLHALTWVRKPHRGDGEDGMPAPRGSGRLTSLAFVAELAKLGADVNLPLIKGESGGGKLGGEGATPFLLAAEQRGMHAADDGRRGRHPLSHRGSGDGGGVDRRRQVSAVEGRGARYGRQERRDGPARRDLQ